MPVRHSRSAPHDEALLMHARIFGRVENDRVVLSELGAPVSPHHGEPPAFIRTRNAIDTSQKEETPMTVKRRVAWIVAAAAHRRQHLASGARASGCRWPIPPMCDPRRDRVLAGVVFGEHMASCAGRATMAFEDELRGFFDLGWSDPDGAQEGNLAVRRA